MDEINIEDFMKLDLRIAKIIHAESVEDADKLLKLYKSDDLDEDDRKMLIEFEKKLRLIFRQVDEIDRDVEVMAKRKRMSDKK